jgi:hypothetical protein
VQRALLVFFFGAGASIAACTRRDPPVRSSRADAAASSGPLPAPSQSAAPLATGPERQRQPKSAAECRQACNGEWSAHGLTGVISCLCRTRDIGNDCRDGAECEGECLLDPVRTELVSAGPPAMGRFIGKCSEFTTTFGCVRRIPKGAKQQGPVELSDPPPEICMD